MRKIFSQLPSVILQLYALKAIIDILFLLPQVRTFVGSLSNKTVWEADPEQLTRRRQFLLNPSTRLIFGQQRKNDFASFLILVFHSNLNVQ